MADKKIKDNVYVEHVQEVVVTHTETKTVLRVKDSGYIEQDHKHVENCDYEPIDALTVKDCGCGQHDHEHDEDCDCESNTIMLDMEDGTQKEYTILYMVEIDGKKYLALSELGSIEYDILEMKEDGDSVELSYVDDDDEYNAVADEFEKIFSESDDEDDEEEEEK